MSYLFSGYWSMIADFIWCGWSRCWSLTLVVSFVFFLTFFIDIQLWFFTFLCFFLFQIYSYGFGAYFNVLPGSEWSAIMLTYGFPLAIIGMALKVKKLLLMWIRLYSGVHHNYIVQYNHVCGCSSGSGTLCILHMFFIGPSFLQYAELKPVPCLTYSDAQRLQEKCATPILKQAISS